MFYKMIENKCKEWYASEQCTVRNLIEYIEKTGQMRDAHFRKPLPDRQGRWTSRDSRKGCPRAQTPLVAYYEDRDPGEIVEFMRDKSWRKM